MSDLRDEIQNDPLALGYAGKLPGEILGMLNNQIYTAVVPVPLGDVLNKMIKNNIFVNIHDAADDTTHSGHGASINMIEMLRNDSFGDSIDISDVATMDILNALVTGSVVSQGALNVLVDMASGMISRAEVLGLGPLSMQDIYGAVS